MILKLRKVDWDFEVLLDGVDAKNVDFNKELTYINVKPNCIEHRPKLLNDVTELINSLDPKAEAKVSDLCNNGVQTMIVMYTTDLQVRVIDPED